MSIKTSAELKRLAREKLNNNYGVPMGATAITIGIYIFVYMLVVTAFVFYLLRHGLFTDAEVLVEKTNSLFFLLGETVVVGVLTALAMTLYVGIFNICMKIDRGEQVSIGDLFYVYSHNPDKVILISLALFLIGELCSVPGLIFSQMLRPRMLDGNIFDTSTMILLLGNYAVSIAGSVASIFFGIMFSQAYLIYLESNDEPITDYLRKSAELINGYKGQYLYLMLSFLGWMLLAALTFGILYLWLMPYMCETFVLFYDELKRVKSGQPGQRVNVVITDNTRGSDDMNGLSF